MHSGDVPHVVYDIGGQRWVKDAPDFADAIAEAYANNQRPPLPVSPRRKRHRDVRGPLDERLHRQAHAQYRESACHCMPLL